MSRVLIVEDQEIARKNLSLLISNMGFDTLEAENLPTAAQMIEEGQADIVMLDVHFPEGSGLTLLSRMQAALPHIPVIVMTAFGDIEMAVDAMHSGALDFVPKPIKHERLERALTRAQDQVQMRQELNRLRQERLNEMALVRGRSPKMKAVLDMVARAAPTNSNVLITGESGTGKEVVAHLLHQLSPRKDKPFMPINCAAIPEHLLESELFGHEAGAFTGATKRKEGLFEAANGGTLFLDEISGMRLDLQIKLLRVLEDRQVRRGGSLNSVKIDVRLVAAANRDLNAMVAAGTFREDLLYRLKVVQFELPPLREREEDIPDFVGAFIQRYNRETGRMVKDIHPTALTALKAYPWPGNVRQLRNTIESAMIFCDGDTLELGHLPAEIRMPQPL